MSGACDRPIELAVLIDYWLEDRDSPDDERIEEHLLGCDGCSGRLRELTALAAGVRRLAHDGAVAMVVTPSFLEKAAEEGLRTREYRLAPGERVSCTVTPDDDLLVGRLLGDFQGVQRLDVVTQTEGEPEHRIHDVPVSPNAQELIVAQAMPMVRGLGRALYRMRLLAQEPGGERVIGEYTFDHFPTPR
jgi:hypothetical protein